MIKMFSILPLDRLEAVPLREAWPHEALNFTPWLALPENLALLAETLGMTLEVDSVEKAVDTFSADILARDVNTGRWVLIENQLESTDHTHLGQILTYAAGLDAETIIWIARDFREPHRAAIDYLNRISSSEHNFFGVQVELLRIGSSAYAPRFNVVAKPNDWSKTVASKAAANTDCAGKQADWQSYWNGFFKYATVQGLPLVNKVAPKEGWCRTAQLKSGAPSAAAWLHRASDRLRAIIWLQGEGRLDLFEKLHQHQLAIEQAAGQPVTWERMDSKKSSMIMLEMPLAARPDLGSAESQYQWFTESIRTLSEAIEPYLEETG